MAKQATASTPTPEAAAAPNGESKRARVTETTYLDGSGDKVTDIRKAAGVHIVVKGGGELTITEGELPAEVANAAKWFGLQTKLTNTLGAAVKKFGPSEAFDGMAGLWETMQNGEWSQRGAGEGGPRISLLVEAAENVFRDAGESDEFVGAIRDQIKAMDEDQRKAFAENKKIKAEVERLKAERAAERARKAAAEAEEGGDELPTFGA